MLDWIDNKVVALLLIVVIVASIVALQFGGENIPDEFYDILHVLLAIVFGGATVYIADIYMRRSR